MKSVPKFIPVFFLLFFWNLSFSQILEGSVFDKKSNMPIQSVTVYIDGTTIATLTDENGHFKIDSKGNTKPDLVMSSLGYLTSRISGPFQYKKIKTFLEEDAISIDEVFIGKGPFTQKEMLRAFQIQFLGTSKAALSCKIENEEDLYFYFDVEKNVLTASSRKPLKITNKYLAYEINFDLADFEVKYKYRTLKDTYVKSSVFAGTTFYKDLSSTKKSEDRRVERYLGSSTHFMHTIANNSWKENYFSFFVDSIKTNPAEYFKISDTLGVKKITILNPSIIHDIKTESSYLANTAPSNMKKKRTFFSYIGKGMSIVQFTEKDYLVDENGNYTPFYGVIFGGYVGALKAGDMLPSDFYQSLNAKP